MPANSPLSINSCCTRRRLPAPIDNARPSPLPRRGACHQEVGHVRSGDKQHQAGDYRQIHSGRSKVLRTARAVGSGSHVDLFVKLARMIVVVIDERLLNRCGPVQADTRFGTSQDSQPVPVGVRQPFD